MCDRLRGRYWKRISRPIGGARSYEGSPWPEQPYTRTNVSAGPSSDHPRDGSNGTSHRRLRNCRINRGTFVGEPRPLDIPPAEERLPRGGTIFSCVTCIDRFEVRLQSMLHDVCRGDVKIGKFQEEIYVERRLCLAFKLWQRREREREREREERGKIRFGDRRWFGLNFE